MIDRQARDKMIAALRSYLGEERTAFQFAEDLDDAMASTGDETVRAVRHALWFYYDDCKDHKIVATKEEWDYFNRLILLLQSDGELEVVPSRREWHPLQGAAALLFTAFLVLVFRVGFGDHLLAYALPFGPPSMLIAWLNARRRRHATLAMDVALAPFPSVGSLRSVRRQVKGFVRRRMPSSVAVRRIRHPVVDRLMWVPWSIMWCMFSPVALLFQMLPERRAAARIKRLTGG